jgi:8-oxo-dGTP pyrophosphatase MutT (NUDIX family)
VTFADAAARLEAALRRDLPGLDAQARMAPVPRGEWPAGFNPARIRNAAGLLLVFPATTTTGTEDTPHIILTVRADTLRRHGGQVSLPGGVLEPGETFEQAALREAHEEVALPLDHVRVLGALTPLDIPVSGFRLHPIVAIADARPTLAPIDGEVAHILEVAVDELLDPASLVRATRERDGIPMTVPAFHIAGHEIWGATAMALAEFLALLGWSG